MMIVWDESKREKVIKAHGIDFAKIEDILDDSFAIHFNDYEHSESETRYGAIGKTAAYGLIVLIYMLETEEEIRFITARRAEKWMVNNYEQQRKRY